MNKLIQILVILFLISGCGTSVKKNKMTEKDISESIKKEMLKESTFTEEQKKNIENYLITPVKESYTKDTDTTGTFELWTVFEEPKDRGKSRVIFYDEEENNFGLGIRMNGKIYYWANYGNFVKTLNAM